MNTLNQEQLKKIITELQRCAEDAPNKKTNHFYTNILYFLRLEVVNSEEVLEEAINISYKFATQNKEMINTEDEAIKDAINKTRNCINKYRDNSSDSNVDSEVIPYVPKIVQGTSQEEENNEKYLHDNDNSMSFHLYSVQNALVFLNEKHNPGNKYSCKKIDEKSLTSVEIQEITSLLFDSVKKYESVKYRYMTLFDCANILEYV